MNNEEYRKQLAKWATDQKGRQQEPVRQEPYRPNKMLVRAPLGCFFLAAAFVFLMIYLIGAAAGFWKSSLF